MKESTGPKKLEWKKKITEKKKKACRWAGSDGWHTVANKKGEDQVGQASKGTKN